MLIINEERLLKRIHTLGAVGLDAEGTCHILIAAGRSDRAADFGTEEIIQQRDDQQTKDSAQNNRNRIAHSAFRQQRKQRALLSLWNNISRRRSTWQDHR